MKEIALALTGLGDKGLTAFIVWQTLDTIEVFTLFGLVTWGCVSVWKWAKSHDAFN